MRISDWSSDVCSSDLLIKSTIVGNSIIPKHLHDIARGGGVYTRGNLILEETTISGNYIVDNAPEPEERNAGGGIYSTASVLIVDSTISGNFRSEERRVGKECVST